MTTSARILLTVLMASVTTVPLGFAASSEQDEPTVFQSSEKGGVMLELYTSQGCHSCPPAEKWINNFSAHEGSWREIVPINLHVDYWDYLGWKDPFARAEFSKRQRLYRHFRHAKNVATPGFVVNGRGWNGWFWGKSLPTAPMKNSGKLVATLQAQSLEVSFLPMLDKLKLDSLRAPRVHVAILGFGVETKVSRGENAGKRLQHDFVVVGYDQEKLVQQSAQTWVSKVSKPSTVDVAMSKQALVVWISDQDDPAPIQVAANWL